MPGPGLVPEILSARLRLRGHRARDHSAATELWQCPEVYRFILGAPLSSQDVWLRILRYSGLWDFLGYGYWAVEERSSGAYVGQLGFADFRRGLVGFDGRYPEAGWVIHPAYAGRGYATEGMKAAFGWLDAQDFGARSFCLISPENELSLRVATKLGFRFALNTPMGSSSTGVFFRDRENVSRGPGD
ncbi:MAG: GNAT family N-acetyltransferase [Pseudomonadota bacterium]